MRSFLIIACMALFSMGMGTGFNVGEYHWDLTCDPETRNQIVDTGFNLYLQQKFEPALAQMQSLEGCNSPKIDEEIMKAHLSLKLGENQLAETYARHAVSLQPQSADALQVRGQVYLQQRRFTLALEDLEQAEKIDPALPEIEKMRLTVLNELGASTDPKPRRPASVEAPTNVL